jgi:hypothetical protein
MAKRSLSRDLDIERVKYRNGKGRRGGTCHEFIELILKNKAFWLDTFGEETLIAAATRSWERQPRTTGPGLLLLNGDKDPLDEFMTRKESLPDGDVEYRKVSTEHAVVDDLRLDAEVKTDNLEDVKQRRDKRVRQHLRALKLAGGDRTMPLAKISTVTK